LVTFYKSPENRSKATVKAAEPSFRSGVSAERRHIRELCPAALPPSRRALWRADWAAGTSAEAGCRDAATPRFLAPTPCLRHDRGITNRMTFCLQQVEICS
jgi:hypothetical protein